METQDLQSFGAAHDCPEPAEGQQESVVVPASEADLKIVGEMMTVGLMYGHKKSKTNPKFKQYIFATRNGIEIIDLAQTLSALESAVEFLKNQINNKGLVLVVASQSAAREAVENLAGKFNFAYINDRWVGGLLTNFKVLSQRIEYFKKVQSGLEKGEFEKYTKKERLMINRNIQRMEKMFSGLKNLIKLPDAILMIDPSLKGHVAAVREAKRMGIPLVAIIDSDDNPDLIDYPIPANDHAKMSIDWIVNKISEKLSDAHA
ncbi:MAG: 30S ribosomal protein S2 [bacterium]|nr:30S ribosomal protein S2 [bacterium]